MSSELACMLGLLVSTPIWHLEIGIEVCFRMVSLHSPYISCSSRLVGQAKRRKFPFVEKCSSCAVTHLKHSAMLLLLASANSGSLPYNTEKGWEPCARTQPIDLPSLFCGNMIKIGHLS